MKPLSPLTRPLFRWKTLRTIVGASPRDRPASIQIAAITGAAAANSLLAAGGTETRGIRERIAPGVRVTLSGESATTTVPRIVTIVRTAKMIVFAWGVNWMANPASNAPTASPAVMPTLPRMLPNFFRFGGASSARVAVNALVAAPVARPCTTRAAITQPMSGAMRNIRVARS